MRFVVRLISLIIIALIGISALAIFNNFNKINNDDYFEQQQQQHPKDISLRSLKSKNSDYVINDTSAPSTMTSVDSKPPNYNVHIFYYPWYGSPQFDGRWLHWNHEILPHWDPVQKRRYATGHYQPPLDIGSNFYPLLGPYSSRDPTVIEQHMQWMRLSGAGVLAVSWYPPSHADDQGRSWDSLMPTLFDAAHRHRLKIAFHIEPYKDRNVSNLYDNFRYIINSYGSHPAFYRYSAAGKLPKPLIYIYDSYLIAQSEWTQLLLPAAAGGNHGNSNSNDSSRDDSCCSIRDDSSLDCYVIGLLVHEKHKHALMASGFDGFYTYFAAESFSFGSTWRNWPMLAKFAHKHSLIFIPSLGPGYVDDRIRPWNKISTRDRRKGAYFNESFGAALACTPRPPILSVTSFNEWHEGTQIEPAATTNHTKYLDYSQDGGAIVGGSNKSLTYLKICAENVDRFADLVN